MKISLNHSMMLILVLKYKVSILFLVFCIKSEIEMWILKYFLSIYNNYVILLIEVITQ